MVLMKDKFGSVGSTCCENKGERAGSDVDESNVSRGGYDLSASYGSGVMHTWTVFDSKVAMVVVE